MPVTTDQSVANSPLFTKLPPELRNYVYEYTLHSESLVNVTKDEGIPEPPLLLTCKTVRREAIGTFYAVNDIRLVVSAFDPSTEILMWKKIAALKIKYGIEVISYANIDRHRSGGRNWQNLVSWLQAYRRREVFGMASSKRVASAYEGGTKERKLLAGMFYVVDDTRKRPWADVEFVLTLLRSGLVACHWQWGVD